MLKTKPQRAERAVAEEPRRLATETKSAARPRLGAYWSISSKFAVVIAFALAWMTLSAYLGWPWILELAHFAPLPVAIVTVSLVALVPGFMSAFLVASLIIDRRPRHFKLDFYPPISVLIAAFNEEQSILETVHNVLDCKYLGVVEVIVIDDGSTDATADLLQGFVGTNLRVIRAAHGGKSSALNIGLAAAKFKTIVTLDADTLLFHDALTRIVERLLSDPPGTIAVAGAILVRNSRENWITRIQEWDYFLGIAAVKRAQSLFQGTLVAQGAFSIYKKKALVAAGGWPDCVGEDIVLTWAMLESGGRIGYAEDAVAFTNVPIDYLGFFKQRQRWSRGLIEAFARHPKLLLTPRLSVMFIYWNLLFPVLDLVYILIFVPGVIAALFGFYLIAGPPTLIILPLALAVNFCMFRAQRPMLHSQHLIVRHNYAGFIFYMLFYGLLMQPAAIVGYFSEVFGVRRSWGTK